MHPTAVAVANYRVHPTERAGSEDEVLAICQSLNRAGRTIVLVTHDAEVGNHYRRIARIEHGRIVQDERVAAAGTLLREAL
jgi:putative ABC transport system ATP-binding protein